jgi:hypothetical protein
LGTLGTDEAPTPILAISNGEMTRLQMLDGFPASWGRGRNIGSRA